MDKKAFVLLVGFSEHEASIIGDYANSSGESYGIARLWETTELSLPEKRWADVCANTAMERNEGLLKIADIVAVNMSESPDCSLYIGAAKYIGGKIVIGVYPVDHLNPNTPTKEFGRFHGSLAHAHLDVALVGTENLMQWFDDEAKAYDDTESTKSVPEETTTPSVEKQMDEYERVLLQTAEA